MDLKLSFETGAPLVEEKPRPVQDVIILGAGPAGLSAAIYAARANHSPLLITGQDIGGQVATTNLVENYPGFTEWLFLSRKRNRHTQLFKDQLKMDEHGYVVTGKHTRTNVEGVFAAGEVTDPRFRQVITSAGMGAAAAMESEEYLAEHAEELSLMSQLA